MNVHANDQQRLREIFCAVRQQATDHEKSQLLDQLCVGNASLRKQVEQLLAAASSASPVDRMGAMLNPTELEFDSALDQRPLVDIASHALIGPYKLLEQIGEGGMGTVYHAQQSKPIRRRVALKIIKLGMDTGQVVARFEAERQALALMDHPNIAKVLDAGATEQGRPYFVMELVKGIPITDYCSREKLDTDQRLKLFIDVCHGVQHAHQKGIIHRDLKPSNILVTLHDGKPVVKIIDFGIAKAIDQELTERTLFTQVSQMIGTPLYMSPEQAEVSGLDIDTRSDVYSLGVLLYELLTGTTPFDRESMRNIGIDEVRRMIRETEPPRPSQRCSTLKAAAFATSSSPQSRDLKQSPLELQGELDWIVMKALEKERDRRYESASAFSADVERYLNDEPVLACPPTLAYRLRKYSKRYRGLLTTAVMLITMLMVATGVSVSYAIQAQQSSQEANEARDDANVQRDAAVAAQELSNKRLKQSRIDVDRALKSLDTIVREVSSAEFAQLPGVDRVRDEILNKAMKFYEEIIAEHDNDPHAREQQALALYHIAGIYEGQDESESHLRELNESIRILEQVSAENPNELQFQYSLLSPLHARLHSALRTPEERLADAERCLDTIKRCDEAAFRHDPSISSHLYYKVAEKLPADSLRARQLVERAIEITESHGLPPIPPTQIFLGDRADEAGDFEAAAKYYQRGIELYDVQGADADRQRAYVERWLSAVETEKLGKVYEKLNQTPQAEEAYRGAVTSARQLFREYHATQIVRDALRDRVTQLADFLDRQGRAEDAIALLDELLLEFPTFEGLHPAKARRHDRLRQYDLALAAYEKAVELDPLDSASIVKLAEVLTWHFSDDQKALALLAGVLEREPTHAGAYGIRSQIHLRQGNNELALADAHKAVEYGPNTWTWSNRANIHIALQNFGRAVEDLELAERDDPDSSYLFQRRGAAKFHLGRYQEALADLTRGIDLNPGDFSTISEIPVAKIASCPSPEFREGMIRLADRCVELNNQSPASLIQRALLLSGLGESDRAKQDLDAVISNEGGPYDQYYRAALLSLKLDDPDRYRTSCLMILKSIAATDKPITGYFAAWTCALAPKALDDYTAAIALSRAAVEAEPTNRQFLNGLGAILMRAGTYAEAKSMLEGIVSGPDHENTSKHYTHYFLAMTEHHLGNADAARTHLKTANELADTEVAHSIPWNRRETIELLRKEAQGLISETGN